jgi:hypothetical protein
MYYHRTREKFDGIRGALRCMVKDAWDAAFSLENRLPRVTSVLLQLLDKDLVVWSQERRPWGRYKRKEN